MSELTDGRVSRRSVRETTGRTPSYQGGSMGAYAGELPYPTDGLPEGEPGFGGQHATGQHASEGQVVKARSSGWLIAALCALLGFALVLQVRQTTTDQLSTLRQDDLVRLLEGVSTRSSQLEAEVDRLEAIRADLLSGADSAQVARDIARQRAATEGILSGRLPAQGPGIRIGVTDPARTLTSSDLVNLLEELRNAGAEAVQVASYRIVASTAFADGAGEIFLDGNVLPRSMVWTVIGDPATLERALEIPGGALPRIRTAGANVEV
ncbi:MAG: DUF881 domain-containing protein, partial [Cellulomonadaceae bacterium]|nr:DUF881 domain-containing protein [Cellulomonadaceae bacterium]